MKEFGHPGFTLILDTNVRNIEAQPVGNRVIPVLLGFLNVCYKTSRNHGYLNFSPCQTLSWRDLKVFRIELFSTWIGIEFQSLTTRWLNTFCLIPSLARGFAIFWLFPLVFDPVAILKNISGSNLSMPLRIMYTCSTWPLLLQCSQSFLIAEPLQTGYHLGSSSLDLFHLQFITPQSRMPDHVPYSRCGRTIVLNSRCTVVSSRQVKVVRTNPNIRDAFLTAWEMCNWNIRSSSITIPKSISFDVNANGTLFISYWWWVLAVPRCMTLHLDSLKPSCHLFGTTQQGYLDLAVTGHCLR